MSWIEDRPAAQEAGFLFVLRSGRRAGFCAVRENFTRKTENFDGAGFPGVSREARLAAGFREKAFAIQMMFQGDLRKQQAPLAIFDDEQAVAAELDILRMDGRRL